MKNACILATLRLLLLLLQCLFILKILLNIDLYDLLYIRRECEPPSSSSLST
jgi:hypothetical protein